MAMVAFRWPLFPPPDDTANDFEGIGLEFLVAFFGRVLLPVGFLFFLHFGLMISRGELPELVSVMKVDTLDGELDLDFSGVTKEDEADGFKNAGDFEPALMPFREFKVTEDVLTVASLLASL